MSREMKKAEIDKCEQAFGGYKPTRLSTSIDMLAVFVHKDNPIKSLTLQQVDAIFSKSRKGGAKEIKTWGDLGLEGDWAAQPISLYGRNSVSGTYTYFKERVLLDGDFRDSVKTQAGSGAVVQAIASDKYAIGYSGIGYKTTGVRAVPLAKNGKAAPIEAVPENAYSTKNPYPLARALFLYLNYKPNSDLDPLRREFIKYIFSKEGQTDVLNSGFNPVKAEWAAAALKSVGVKP